MGAEADLHAGRLTDALTDLQGRIRKQPADPKPRIFLFQLLCVMGQWDRALTQLAVLSDMDASTIAMVQTYREAIRCELLRAQVFAGATTPLLLGDPAEWMAHLLRALKLASDGHYDEAAAIRERAFEAAPATSGVIDGARFEWIADGDSRVGPMLEAIINGRYYWVPWQRLREVRLEKPVDLRDLVWTPAHLTLANGGEKVALLPSRYPGSEAATDTRLVMGRATEWIEKPGGLVVGIGQREFVSSVGEHPLMATTVINLDTAAGDFDDSSRPASTATEHDDQ